MPLKNLQERKAYLKKYHKKYYNLNKKRILEKNKRYALANPEKTKLYQINAKIKNPNYHKIYKRKWREKNIEKIRIKDREYQRQKRINDIQFVIKDRLRARLREAFEVKHIKKLKNSIYGIDWQSIVNYLGNKPDDKHNWHIDHIKPLSSFDLTKLEQIKQAFAPENHQWLTAEENLKKSNKF